jgi:low temperature requirement protein LtrA
MSTREAEQRVTPLELFFDLVFVFAITRVTTFLSVDMTWGGLLRGLMVLGVLWWTWAAFAWLTNAMPAEDGPGRLVIFVAMGGMLVASLAVPRAFSGDALAFALAIAVVRIAHLVAYVVAGGAGATRTVVLKMSPSVERRAGASSPGTSSSAMA